MKLILVVVSVFLVGAHARKWLGRTSYDNYFKKSCGGGEAIARLQSQHSNKKEDRWWNFYCMSGYYLDDNSATWSSYANSWDGKLDFNCGSNKALVGASSSHNNKKEDRRWTFQCKSFRGIRTINCKTTGYINNYDGNMDYTIGSTTRVLTGVYSTHNNKYEDRRWKLKYCYLCSTSVYWSRWSAWGRCSRSCTPLGVTPGSQTRKRTCRSRTNQRVCRGITCSTQSQSQQCNQKIPCPVRLNGRWSCWSAWSKCSNGCGAGTRTRTRSCSNPTPITGGTRCSGISSQRRTCNTVSYEPTPGAGIQGYDDRVYTRVSLRDCINKCKTEKAFPCLSFEYSESLKRCHLSKRNKNGVRFITGGSFANYAYFERKCKPNTGLSVTPTAIRLFADRCHTGNCYSSCGESKYMNKVLTGNHVTLRYIRFDLSQLPTVLSGKQPTKVTVHAQSVYLTRGLNIPFDLVIVARQVYFRNSYFRYKGATVSKCVKSTIQLDCSINVPMTLISYYGSGRIDIYAEAVSGTPRCSTGRLITSTPSFDVTALKAAMACAQDLATGSSAGYNPIAYNILSYIHHVSYDSSGFTNRNDAGSLRNAAVSLRNYMDLRKANKRPVPILSQSSYNNMLSRYSIIFQVYHARFDNIFSTNANIKNRLADVTAAVEQFGDALRLQEKKLEFAATRVQESELALTKLTDEFDKANNALDVAKNTFENGLNHYKSQAKIRAGFQFVQLAGQMMSAAAGVAGAAKSDSSGPDKVFEMIEAVTDLVTTVVDLASLITDMTDLAAAIATVQGWSKDVNTAVNGLQTPANAADVMASAEATSKMRVKLVVWENMKNTGDTMLTADPMPDITGSADYHKALADMANWGSALTQQTLDHASLVNDYIVESMTTEAARLKVGSMQNLLKSAESSTSISNQLLQEVSGEVIGVQLAAMRVTSDFCKTFFFFNLKECEAKYRLHLSDTLTQTRQKLAELSVSTLEAARAFGSQTPLPFNAHHILKDTITRGCTDPQKCPITTLKSRKQLLVNIPLTSTNFRGLERVRIEETRIFLDGVRFKINSQSVKVYFDNLGEMKDQYSGMTYDFIGVDRKFTYSFDYTTHQTLEYACVDSSISHAYYQLTPFGNWVIQIYDPTNALDLRALTRVEIYFLGSAIRSNTYRPPVEGNQYRQYGEADRSQQCAGSGRVTKRSIR